MDCVEARSQISSFVDGRMPDDVAPEFFAHVESCPACYDELEIQFTLLKTLQLLETGDAESFDMRKLLRDTIAKRKQEISASVRNQYLWVLFGILVILFLLAFALFVLMPEEWNDWFDRILQFVRRWRG